MDDYQMMLNDHQRYDWLLYIAHHNLQNRNKYKNWLANEQFDSLVQNKMTDWLRL